jgi:hypothetical protein
MLEADEFLQYAQEAIRSSLDAKTEEERAAFLDLANVWSRAERHSREMFPGVR